VTARRRRLLVGALVGGLVSPLQQAVLSYLYSGGGPFGIATTENVMVLSMLVVSSVRFHTRIPWTFLSW